MSNGTSKFKSKIKGNKFEHKVAKEISEWMFKDKTVVGKDPTSGARKYVYKGDIIPVKAHAFPWKAWPFIFELKNGYKDHIPTLMNYSKVKEWILKLISECDDNQYIPILILQFHYQIPILITNHILNNIKYSIILNIEYNNNFFYFYVYDYKDILNLNFFDVWPNDIISILEIK
jgi:hypothetical protein